jgi:4'-phosphopantetheinyl transferase
MALGSRLVKRYLIARYASVPWDQAVTTRNSDTKPVFRRPDGSEPLSFNVSHQAGLVVLVASVLHPAELGVDVVCPTERRDRDLSLIRAEGWGSFVDMHAEVFGPDEVSRLHGLGTTLRDQDQRLRYFYTLWCIREAYVKMTGEALLAPWLKDLEMRYFVPAEDAAASQTEIWFRGRRVDDVDLDLVNVLGGFTICTAVRRRDRQGAGRLAVGEYELLDAEEVISFGERSRRGGWSEV